METAEVDPRVKGEEKDLAVLGTKFFRVRNNFIDTYNALAARLQGKPYFVDFRNALCSRTTPVYEADGVHLKPQGNNMVANRLAEMLRTRGWLGN